MFTNIEFILASKSKSRLNILKANKLNFFQRIPTCKEEFLKNKKIKDGLSLEKISLFLAKEKAKSVAKNNLKILVVGSDTTIIFRGKIVGKALNKKEAKIKLKKLSGQTHAIHSSAVAYFNNKLVWQNTQKTLVKIRKLTDIEIKKYLKSCKKDILHSVGCYQIEENGPNIIENIRGDFFNVMGFPLFPFLIFLKKFNITK